MAKKAMLAWIDSVEKFEKKIKSMAAIIKKVSKYILGCIAVDLMFAIYEAFFFEALARELEKILFKSKLYN